jgi:tRNA (guanine-N7-)-methyltransferase
LPDRSKDTLVCAGNRAKRQLYGRRQGHKLRKSGKFLVGERLTSLAVPVPADPNAASDPMVLFPFPVRSLWLEIGFGGGEHLAAQAAANPDVGLIGCEPFINGVASLLRQIDDRGLRNVRIHADDARDLLDRLPDGVLDRVFILFPDPWPKARHHRRRFVSRETLHALARVMADGAELRLATDHTGYGHWMLAHLIRHSAFVWMAEKAADWRHRSCDWPATRYERKARAKGEACLYLRFRRVAREQGPKKTT